MISERNKDLEMFGRRESSQMLNEDPFRVWMEVVSARESLELRHKVFGNPGRDAINNLYKKFIEDIEKLKSES